MRIKKRKSAVGSAVLATPLAVEAEVELGSATEAAGQGYRQQLQLAWY